MKITKNIKMVAGIIFIIFLLVLLLIINHSYGFIRQERPLDPTLHISENTFFAKEGVVIIDFKKEPGPGQSPLSNLFLPGTWVISIKAQYDDKILEQEIVNCREWGTGAGLPEGSLECDGKLYTVEIDNKNLIINKSSYDFESDTQLNKKVVKSISLPDSITTLRYAKTRSHEVDDENVFNLTYHEVSAIFFELENGFNKEEVDGVTRIRKINQVLYGDLNRDGEKDAFVIIDIASEGVTKPTPFFYVVTKYEGKIEASQINDDIENASSAVGNFNLSIKSVKINDDGSVTIVATDDVLTEPYTRTYKFDGDFKITKI